MSTSVPNSPAAEAVSAPARDEGTHDRPLRVLVVSAMYPTADDPVRGVVVAREVARLRRAGLHVEVVGKAPGAAGYLAQARGLRRAAGRADLVHAHFGTTGFVAALLCGRRPLVVTMHGSDIAHGPRPSRSKYWPQYLLSVAGALRARAVVLQDASMLSTLPPPVARRCRVLGQPVAVPEQAPPEVRAGVLFLSDRARAVKRFPLAQAAADLAGVTLDSLDAHPVDEVPEAMASARVGLLTSEREGLPVAVKEALAAGLRVVSVRLPSLEPLAALAPEALRLTEHDPRSLADALLAALEAPPLDEPSRRGLHRLLAERGWTEGSHTQELTALYRRLLPAPRRRGGDRDD